MDINIELFRNKLQLQRYSENSIRSYLNCIQQLNKFFKNYRPEEISIELIDRHVQWLIEDKEISKSYQKQILIAVQKYFDLVVNLKLDLSKIYPKHQDIHLPNCISKINIKAMIENTQNLKHKTILCLMYSGGLRPNELLNLTINDIDTQNCTINIKQVKDKKSRTVMCSDTLREMLPRYYEKYKPKHFVFEGQNGLAYTEKSLQQVVKLAAIRAGINFPVTPLCLRHSFATHLIDNGTDIHYVQELLGHQSIKTTEIYTHTSDVSNTKIKSPLDLL
jgi:site-specific recombinase XerD